MNDAKEIQACKPQADGLVELHASCDMTIHKTPRLDLQQETLPNTRVGTRVGKSFLCTLVPNTRPN